MKPDTLERGYDELRAARRESRALYWFVAIFSFFANMLMLTGPMYMLQVYDRVLGSGSVETLIALSALVAFLYGTMGVLDFSRSRIMARVGARFQSRLDRRVFDAVIRKSAVAPDDKTAGGMRDLESVQQLMTSPALMALFDIPWTPVFIAGIFLFHPWLGYLALFGGVSLILITIANQMTTRRPGVLAQVVRSRAEEISTQVRSEAEMVQAMGMRANAFDRWQKMRGKSLVEQIRTSDLRGGFTSFTKAFRLFLQSAMLGLGAYLVLLDELTPGAMIAGSILLGRALAPIELTIGQWPLVQMAMRGWDNLAELLGEVPKEVERTPLPKPRALLEAQQVTVLPPGENQAVLRMISFVVRPGQAVGVIGASGAGKSSLARALTGVWRPAGGKIRLDGAALDQYDPEALGRYIGYLPQRVQLFDGTIAENIARLSDTPDPKMVVEAARKADAHDLILKMPAGYDTQVTSVGSRLSGGQIQRIGLARAMYGDPVILVLDEPNSNLDVHGSEALNRAIRAMKAEQKSVLIMAHRPAAIQECDMLLMLENGSKTAFGPKDEVLREKVKNYQEIMQSKDAGGAG